MALASDWSFSVLGVTAGEGTDYCPAGPIGGLGAPPMRTFDAQRGDRAGDAGGRDVHAARTLTFPVVVKGDGGTRRDRLANAIPKAMTLAAAWGQAVGAGEVGLELRLPGFPGAASTLTYYGRPRACPLDMTGDALGHVPALLEFRCLDPFAYALDPVYAGGSGPSFTNPGTARSDRATVTFGAGTPTITKDATGESFGFLVPIGGGTTVDLRTGTVYDVNGNDVSDRLAPGPQFFTVDPGYNSFSTGGAFASFYYQPAYLI